MNTNQKLMADLQEISGEAFTFSSFMIAIRQGEDLSQVEFARILGVSKQFICDLERGRRFVSPKVAEQFALKLGYSPTQFVRLCLQEMITKQGLKYFVELKVA
jgi:transcriptional regulator with XRE-family HTH domain